MNLKHILTFPLMFLSAFILTSCYYSEDPGPVQSSEKEFAVLDFDRVDMGDAFNIKIEQGDLFRVNASGDSRNIDDLVVKKEGSTLVIRYDENRNRRHTTYISITMPVLKGATLSGASESWISGFEDLGNHSINLSGASVSQVDVVADEVEVTLSGASTLFMHGESNSLHAAVSGASALKAFYFTSDIVSVNVSGASNASVVAVSELNAVATGASVVNYRGNPAVTSEVSGSSTVRKD